MASKNIEVFTGGTFDFIVEGTKFTVYKVLIARVSEPLKAMMLGGMQEALAGVATLQEVTKETFARFVEWSITGDYNIVDPSLIEAGYQADETDKPEESYELAPPPPQPEFHEEKSAELLQLSPLPTQSIWSDCPKYLIRSSFLLLHLRLHLRLFILAHLYAIDGLCVLASNRFCSILAHEPCVDETLYKMVALFRFVQDKVPDMDGCDSNIQNTVMDWVVRYAAELTMERAFIDLVHEGGDFAAGMVVRMSGGSNGQRDGRSDAIDGTCGYCGDPGSECYPRCWVKRKKSSNSAYKARFMQAAPKSQALVVPNSSYQNRCS